MFTEGEWWGEAVSRRADSPAFSASGELWQGSCPDWRGITDSSKIIPSITHGCECCSFSVLSRGHHLPQATTLNSQASPGPGLMEELYPERKVGIATPTPTNYKISVSWVSPSCIHQLWSLGFFPQGCEKSMRFVLQTDHYDKESSAMKLICVTLTSLLITPLQL